MRITVVTSSRADWNSTGMVVRALQKEWPASVSILVIAASGPAFDALKMAMAEDGVITGDITWASLNLTKDDPVNLANAAGKACSLAGEVFYTLKPDLVFLPGDRWEIAQVAFAASLAGIPIAHLGGGDVTVGSMDDAFRDCISRLAAIHFTTNEAAYDKLSWQGHIAHLVGSPSIDRIKATPLMSREEAIGNNLMKPVIVINWQPETKAGDPNEGLRAIIEALPENALKIFIDQNPDFAWQEADAMIREAGDTPKSFTPRHYLSLLKHCDLLIGNSSSGIYEAPYFGTPVIDVGDRQKGRPRWSSVKECHADVKEIREWIDRMIDVGRFEGDQEYIYGDGTACEKIVKALKAIA